MDSILNLPQRIGAEPREFRARGYVRTASLSTRGRACKHQPLLELCGSWIADVPVPDTARPGTLTSRKLDPDGTSASARSATATLSGISARSPSSSSRPERRWKTREPSANDADAMRDAKAPASPTARAAAPTP